jgi:hypothetical protein
MAKAKNDGAPLGPYPDRRMAMTDMGLTSRDETHAQPVALCRTPIDLAGRSLADDRCQTRASDIHAFRRAKRTAGERNAPDPQIIGALVRPNVL